MIPRYQIVLFLILLMAAALLGGVLWHLRERTHERLLAGEDSAPTLAPLVAPLEQATLLVAQDRDNSLQTRLLSLPLPQESEARARAVLGKLLDLYAEPGSGHPVPGGASSIAQVFLLPAAEVGAGNAASPAADRTGVSETGAAQSESGPELAVVNLTGAFVASHPSGLETETLTVLSICATLHANFPDVTEVRFLVGGQPRATLAGHADLTRTYLTGDTVPLEGARP